MLHNQNSSKRIIFDIDGLPFLAEDFSYEQQREVKSVGGVGGSGVSTGTTNHMATVHLNGAFILEEVATLVTGPNGQPETTEIRVQTDDGLYIFRNAFVSYQPESPDCSSVEVELSATSVEVHN